MQTLQRVQDGFIGIFVGILIMCGVGMYYNMKPSLPAVPGETPTEFVAMPKETVPCKQVQALPAKVKKTLVLPPIVVQDEQERLIAVVHVPQVDYPQLAGALVNTTTGIGSIYFTPQPRPWLDFNRKWAVGVAYSPGEDKAEYRAYGRWKLLQIKRLHFGVLGEVYADRFVGSGFGEFN